MVVYFKELLKVASLLTPIKSYKVYLSTTLCKRYITHSKKTSKFGPIHSTIQIWTDFHESEAKKNIFFDEKNSKWPIFQNGRFSKSPILKFFLQKLHRLVLGLVGLIDAKGINVTQPIWPSGCPM